MKKTNFIDTDNFIKQNFILTEQSKKDFDLIQHMQDVFVGIGEREGWQHNSVGGAPCQMDLRFIYSMVSLVKPKKVIEIGTWSGLSAHVIALAMSRYADDFQIDTCDVVNVYQSPEEFKWLGRRINFYNNHSTKFLNNLKDKEYDFIFSDASLTDQDAKLMKKKIISDDKLFFMTHDVYPNKYEKGNQALDILKYSFNNVENFCFIPNKLDVGYNVDGKMINSCTAFLIAEEVYDGIK